MSSVTVKKLTDNLSVCAQPQIEDIQLFADMGFKTLINNRPDGEAADQPDETDMAHAAQRAGLRYIYLPITPGQFSEQAITTFNSHLDNAEGPVLAFCRTGTRSTTLWALSQAGQGNAEKVIDTAAQAGYDLSNLAGQL